MSVMNESPRPSNQPRSRLARRVVILASVSLLLLSGCDSVVDTDPEERATPVELTEPADRAETANAVLFSWTGSAPTGWFRLQVARDSLFTEISTDVKVGTVPRHIARELRQHHTHYWRVRREHDGGADSWSDIRSFTPTRTALLPERPVLRSPADLAGPLPREVTVEWASVPHAISYHLQVFMDEDLLLYQTDLEDLTATRNHISDLVYTYPYWWRVRAESLAGYGAWSTVWKFQVEDGE